VFVRWDNLLVKAGEEQRRLPRLDGAVIRTFDAPEALGVRFHEIQARSALNRVPAASRMPFRFTVNPYRGCAHACTYCTGGDTPILMADGRTKPIAEVRVGDEIYGTVRRGNYRRYVTTEVLAHWSTIKPGYRVTLQDGTELLASGDHRFWTRRGKWKFVTGAEQGLWRRPHLTLDDDLLGTGEFAAPPDDVPDYRRGYLCGVIRGDGHIGSYSYQRPGRSHGNVHRFRLALTDLEALRRARKYLADIEVETQEFAFQAAVAGRRPITAVRTQAQDKVEKVRQAIRWPRDPSDQWAKGFLAGIFDAEGSYSQSLRIANCDQEIIDWTTYCLRRFGFSHVIEKTSRPNGLTYLRLTGDLKQHLRFFHTVDPAITRKRTIEGMALKSDAALGVESIEPLGVDLPMFDITTGTGDFIANGVVSHNCFARPTHTYLDLDAGRDFEREIVVKVNVPELLRAEVSRPRWKREHVALGTNTDPYQWVESRYKLMPGIWEALRDSNTPGSLVTKSPLALRDISLLKEMADGPGMSVYFSVPTLDERAWRETEPHTPSPRARLDALRKLNEAGVPAGILIAPLMPGVNDTPEEVAEIVRIAEDAGAISIGAVALHLRGEVRGIFFDWLREHRPELLPRYEKLYERGAYVPAEESKRLQALVKGRRRRSRPPANRTERGKTKPRAQRPREPEQKSLF
jgi:DNA repair photolyase